MSNGLKNHALAAQIAAAKEDPPHIRQDDLGSLFGKLRGQSPADELLDSQLPDETGRPEFSIENDSPRPTDNGWCENDN